MSPVMVDLCAGLKGAIQAMRDRGWRVVSVDIDPAFEPDVCADLLEWEPDADLIGCDLAWASPPCDEFSRESMPWSRTGRRPSLALVRAAQAAIMRLKPRYWAIENVRGSLPWLRPILGEPTHHIGPCFLWSNLPPFGPRGEPFKEFLSGKQKAERAKVPYKLSLCVALLVEAQRIFGDVDVECPAS